MSSPGTTEGTTQRKPRSALTANLASPDAILAPKATRPASRILDSSETTGFGAVPELGTIPVPVSGSGSLQPASHASQRFRRLAFQPGTLSSTSPAPPSPARGASASPSVPQLSSSYLSRGSFQKGFPPASLQSLSGFPISRRRPSVYRAYRGQKAGEPSLVVFSGGSGFNPASEEIQRRLTTRVTHVLPVSDDGGSTAEIVRVLGGPAVGDIRSRCLRLSDDSTDEGQAVKALLGHRLHATNPSLAKHEWSEICEGTHGLWKGIGAPYRDTIRSFLVHFNYEVMRESESEPRFNFCNGSVGNFFFAGARRWFRSMDAAIFLYGRVSHVPPQSLVTPAVSTSDRLILGAELYDGTIIRGQNSISHPPSLTSSLASPSAYASSSLVVQKDTNAQLSARIRRVFYASPDVTSTALSEIYPAVHPSVLSNIFEADGIVYAMGSFFTSICPSLVLKEVGEAIARRKCRKILVLNGSLDRETGGMERASDYVRSLTEHLNRAGSLDAGVRIENPASSYVNCLFIPRGSDAIEIDESELRRLGIRRIVSVDTQRAEPPLSFEKVGSTGSAEVDRGKVFYDTADLIRAMKRVLSGQRNVSDSLTVNGAEDGFDDSEDEWVSEDEVELGQGMNNGLAVK